MGRHSKKARGQSRRYARKPSVWSEIRGYLLTVIAVMLVVLLGRTFVFNVYVIPSRSMEDTLQIGDRVFASRLTPRLFTLHRGDIIVFKDPADWMEGEQLPTNLMSNVSSVCPAIPSPARDPGSPSRSTANPLMKALILSPA